MPRSDEAEWWFNAVYAAVQEIPPGKVTSYGHIATLLGKRELLLYRLAEEHLSDWQSTLIKPSDLGEYLVCYI